MKGRDYLAIVGGLPCVLCAQIGHTQSSRTTVHHVREGQGMAQRAQDWLACALCVDCHQGPGGLHGDRTLMRVAKVDEMDLLALTIQGVMQRADE